MILADRGLTAGSSSAISILVYFQVGKLEAVTTEIAEDRLGETFAALANATRRAILARLAQGAATVNELAEPFDLTLPAISKHIKVLERAGLVSAGNGPSTGRAPSTLRRSRRSRRGPSSTDRSGRPASTGWTTTSANSNRDERPINTMTDDVTSRRLHGDRTNLRRPGGTRLADVDRPGTLPGVVRPGRRHDSGREAGRAGRRSRQICMEIRTPDGPMQMWFAGEHREVVENECLVYTESMSMSTAPCHCPRMRARHPGIPP